MYVKQRQSVRRRYLFLLAMLAAVAATIARGQSPRGPEKIDAPHLPNAYRLHPRVISGGLPEGEAAFRELQSLGVKTLISVDSAAPDVQLAAAHGMRYVHLPHGYDGVPRQRVLELAKAVRDLPGPIYVHCHHGKHRAPTAAAVACVAARLMDANAAENVLLAAGTSDAYRGLYQAARDARPLDTGVLDALAVDLPAKAAVPPLAEAMVTIDQRYDDLQRMSASGWKAPPDKPDQTATHEALQLREQFAELARGIGRQRPEAFLRQLRGCEATASELESALKANDSVQAKTALARLTKQCADCHRVNRDVPLGEK
jgi:protein tyrosine phosphatase (PTP) superfamily phosphohydrolase (DUF442 family)